jgi:hypothetical protein
VINTVDPNYFKKNIAYAYKARKDYHTQKNKRTIKIAKEFLDIIMRSNMPGVSGKTTRASHMLRVDSKVRRPAKVQRAKFQTLVQFEEETIIHSGRENFPG